MKNGFTIIVLLFGLLMISFLSLQYFTGGKGGAAGDSPVQAIEKAWDAVCATNKMLIRNQLQMYAMNHDPMKTLDLDRLFSPGQFPNPPKNCPCKYSFDATGNVICSVHH